MIMVKETIVLMQNQITELNEQIRSLTTINISGLVGLAVSSLDKPDMSEILHKVEIKTEGLKKFDICWFESEN